MKRSAEVDVIRGRGRAMFCTYRKGCGALPTHRVRYHYPHTVISFGACHLHARQVTSRL